MRRPRGGAGRRPAAVSDKELECFRLQRKRFSRQAFRPSRHAAPHEPRLRRAPRLWRCIQRVDQAAREPLDPGPGDHRRVVGTQPRRRDVEGEAPAFRQRLDAPSDFAVGRDAPCHDQRRRLHVRIAEHGDRVRRAVREHVGDRPLKRRGNVGAVLIRQCAQRLDGVKHGGLEPREREIASRTSGQWPGQGDAIRVAVPRRALDRRPPRIA